LAILIQNVSKKSGPVKISYHMIIIGNFFIKYHGIIKKNHLSNNTD